MNTEFKGTKGEWQTYIAINQMSKGGSIDIISEDILSVGVPGKTNIDDNLLVALCGNKNREEVKANAQLIATAPELLKQLQILVNDCENHNKQNPNNVFWIKEAKATIQKALNP